MAGLRSVRKSAPRPESSREALPSPTRVAASRQTLDDQSFLGSVFGVSAFLSTAMACALEGFSQHAPCSPLVWQHFAFSLQQAGVSSAVAAVAASVQHDGVSWGQPVLAAAAGQVTEQSDVPSWV